MKAKIKPRRGRGPARPSLDDPKVVDALCDRLSGGQSIFEACKLKTMPSEREVYAHMARDEFFSSRIARAREAQQEFEADNCVKMADAATVEDYQLVRLRIWARQWRASHLAPRKYGGARAPIEQHNVANSVSVNVSLTTDEYREITRELLERI